MIEVQRARVRALCARLMQRPTGFNLTDCSRCSLGMAERMPEFAHVVADPLEILTHPDKFFGLNENYFCFVEKGPLPAPQRGWWLAIIDNPYRIALFYLEAIGDCGPVVPVSIQSTRTPTAARNLEPHD